MKNTHLAILCTALFFASEGVGQVPLNPNPSRVLGQPKLIPTSGQPNLVDGRGLYNPQSMAVDVSSSPPKLYVADTGNDRVLGWRDASTFTNAAQADIVIGQRDLSSTVRGGPGTALVTGLYAPTAVAVDKQGNLYVCDAGNNRILRFPQPFQQPGELKIPDMVIGQSSLNSRTSNFGGLSATSIATLARTGPFATGLTFDANGNLYFSDAGNNRLLRYPASALDSGANGPAADLVLGQPDFVTASQLPIRRDPTNKESRYNKGRLLEPSSVAFDSAGRIFVTDRLSRALVYVPPFRNGMDAARIMGLTGLPNTPSSLPINEYSLGFVTDSNQSLPPQGVFTIGNIPFVVDTFMARILRYSSFENWPSENVSISPPAVAVIGQSALTDPRTDLLKIANRGRPEPARSSLYTPTGAVFADGKVFVADTSNNRVLVFPDLSTGPATATGAPYEAQSVLGQINFDLRAPNLIEGREFFFGPSASGTAAGVVVDTTSDPPRLYVADANNNRVLGFADARRIRTGDKADLVIGQPDLFRSLVNYPTNDSTTPTDTGLFLPTGVVVDSEGNLYVADSGNGRVLRFPRPFAQPPGLQRANLVLGQPDFNTVIKVATSRSMASPIGLAFTAEGHLLVSDAALNRVLLFFKPFSNGMAATKVFGQADFASSGSGNTLNPTTRMNSPRHIATDTDDRLYVSDSGNNRVLVFRRATAGESDPVATFALGGVRSPQGIFVSSSTGEIWVADLTGNRAVRYPRFDDLVTQPNVTPFTIPENAPLALAQDAFGDLFVADSLNRVVVHYPEAAQTNAANYLPRLTPGMIASLFPLGPDFNSQVVDWGGKVPVPTVLDDIQVLVDDVPAPLYLVSPRQINFIVPTNAPSSGIVEIQVVRASLGQILATKQAPMDVASPGLFTIPPVGTGQIAAINQDGTINSTENPVARGEVIQLFATGAGFISGAPPDGIPASGPVSTEVKPRVFVGSRFLDDADILYSGLAPGLAGVWQINIRIPDFVPPSNVVPVVVIMSDIPSNNPGDFTTIAVKQ